MKYRFKNTYRQFNPGDEVPESLGRGFVNSLLLRGVVELVTSAKQIDAPPANKMVETSSRKSRKGNR